MISNAGFTITPSTLDHHEMQRVQAVAGFGEGFFEGGLVGL